MTDTHIQRFREFSEVLGQHKGVLRHECWRKQFGAAYEQKLLVNWIAGFSRFFSYKHKKMILVTWVLSLSIWQKNYITSLIKLEKYHNNKNLKIVYCNCRIGVLLWIPLMLMLVSDGVSAGGLRAAGHFWMNHQWWKLLPTIIFHSLMWRNWDHRKLIQQMELGRDKNISQCYPCVLNV